MEEFKTDVFDTIKSDSIPIITQSDSPVKDPVQLESFIDEEETEDDDDQFEDADDSELLIPETSVTTTNNNEDDNGSSNFNDTVIHNDLDSSRDKITDPISIQIDKAKTITPKKHKRMSRLISTNSQSLNMIGSSPVNSDNEISNFEENLDIDLDLGIDIDESHDIHIDYNNNNNNYQNDNDDDIVNDTDIDYGKETELDSKNNFKLRNTNISKPQMLKSLEISNDAPWRRAAAASRAASRSSNINNRPISRLSYYESNNNNNSTMIHDSNLSGMMSGLSFNDNMINSKQLKY
ncbi:hypothetical protein B5S28_g3478 [[Candida] boidinii]|nr:hypothetical protein B5S28_g3478 [[Candida] boidinii]